ncbi:hypothetical protein AAG906_013222 [Vitis piasezkii]
MVSGTCYGILSLLGRNEFWIVITAFTSNRVELVISCNRCFCVMEHAPSKLLLLPKTLSWMVLTFSFLKSRYSGQHAMHSRVPMLDAPKGDNFLG